MSNESAVTFQAASERIAEHLASLPDTYELLGMAETADGGWAFTATKMTPGFETTHAGTLHPDERVQFSDAF